MTLSLTREEKEGTLFVMARVIQSGPLPSSLNRRLVMQAKKVLFGSKQSNIYGYEISSARRPAIHLWTFIHKSMRFSREFNLGAPNFASKHSPIQDPFFTLERRPAKSAPDLSRVYFLNPETGAREITLESAPPTWNSVTKQYELNLEGVATVASVKNLSIFDGESNALIVGKREKGELHVKFRYPFSLLEAFAVGLSTF